MDITRPINTLSQDLARAAQVGGSDVHAAAERLLLALDPALRLAFIDVLSQAANEISASLPGVAVSVRLEGRDPVFAIDGAPSPAAGPDQPAPAADEGDEGDQTARITLRIPEALKTRAEALASRAGQSLNTWLVAAARAAAQDGPDPSANQHGRGRRHGMGRRVQGWVR